MNATMLVFKENLNRLNLLIYYLIIIYKFVKELYSNLFLKHYYLDQTIIFFIVILLMINFQDLNLLHFNFIVINN